MTLAYKGGVGARVRQGSVSAQSAGYDSMDWRLVHHVYLSKNQVNFFVKDSPRTALSDPTFTPRTTRERAANHSTAIYASIVRLRGSSAQTRELLEDLFPSRPCS